MKETNVFEVRKLFDNHEYQALDDFFEKHGERFLCEGIFDSLLLKCVKDFARDLIITENGSKLFGYDPISAYCKFQVDFQEALIRLKERKEDKQVLKNALISIFSDIDMVIIYAIGTLGELAASIEDFREDEKDKERLYNMYMNLLQEILEHEITWKTNAFSIIKKGFSDVFNMELILCQNKECESVIDCKIIFK